MSRATVCIFVLILVLSQAWCSPLRHDPLSVSDLTTRIESRLDNRPDPRLPIPTPQELEAIKKVGQILVMLGEQVIPTILGDSPPSNCDTPTVEDIINDDN